MYEILTIFGYHVTQLTAEVADEVFGGVVLLLVTGPEGTVGEKLIADTTRIERLTFLLLGD